MHLHRWLRRRREQPCACRWASLALICRHKSSTSSVHNMRTVARSAAHCVCNNEVHLCKIQITAGTRLSSRNERFPLSQIHAHTPRAVRRHQVRRPQVAERAHGGGVTRRVPYSPKLFHFETLTLASCRHRTSSTPSRRRRTPRAHRERAHKREHVVGSSRRPF